MFLCGMLFGDGRWSEGLMMTILLGMDLSTDVSKMHSYETIPYFFYGLATYMPPKQGKLASVCLQRFSSIFEKFYCRANQK